MNPYQNSANVLEESVFEYRHSDVLNAELISIFCPLPLLVECSDTILKSEINTTVTLNVTLMPFELPSIHTFIRQNHSLNRL